MSATRSYHGVCLCIGKSYSLAGLRPVRHRQPAQPKGKMTWAIHFTIAPTFLSRPIIWDYVLSVSLCAPRRAGEADCRVISGLPAGRVWSESEDGLMYEFKLRQGVTSTTVTRSPSRM